MTRRSIALLLLCAQASAAAHLLLTQHTIGEFGAIVDAEKPCSQAHHRGAGIAHGHAVEQRETECGAAALARSLGQAQGPLCAVIQFSAVSAPAGVEAAPQIASLDPLSVAPKSSPPV